MFFLKSIEFLITRVTAPFTPLLPVFFHPVLLSRFLLRS